LDTVMRYPSRCIDSCNISPLLSVLNLVAMSSYSMYIRLVFL